MGYLFPTLLWRLRSFRPTSIRRHFLLLALGPLSLVGPLCGLILRFRRRFKIGFIEEVVGGFVPTVLVARGVWDEVSHGGSDLLCFNLGIKCLSRSWITSFVSPHVHNLGLVHFMGHLATVLIFSLSSKSCHFRMGWLLSC